MSIAGQIREEANRIANSMTLEIMDAASKGLTSNRFDKLRKKKAYPVTEQEARYVRALNMYVHLKLQLRKYNFTACQLPQLAYSQLDWSRKVVLERERDRYRAEMDKIEYGLDGTLIHDPNDGVAEFYYGGAFEPIGNGDAERSIRFKYKDGHN